MGTSHSTGDADKNGVFMEPLGDDVIMAYLTEKKESYLFPRSGRPGFTFLEVLVALSVMLVAVCTALYVLMGVIKENRMTRMQIIANSLIRAKADEIYSHGIIDKLGVGDLAPAAICHYANEFDGETFHLISGGGEIPQLEMIDLPGGRGKALTHRFPIGDDADPLRSDGEFSARAVGTALFYLDETSVRPLPGQGSDARLIWRDRGVGENLEELDVGFDMNRDGEIKAPTVQPTLSMLKDNPGNLGVIQAPVDITITFFSDSRRSSEIYSLTRRIVLTETKPRVWPGDLDGVITVAGP